jgi:hypothetical protein
VDCSDQLKVTAKRIAVSQQSPTLNKALGRASTTIQRAIVKEFNERGLGTPKFRRQGSVSLGTVIKPPPGGEVDIDLGVYLSGMGSDPDSWVRPTTVQDWIVEATEEITLQPPERRSKCVRLTYSGRYHVDLPVYIRAEEDEDGNSCFVADRQSNEWVPSNPKAFEDWFWTKVDRQRQRALLAVRLLKLWRQHCLSRDNIKPPSGFVFTVFAGMYLKRYQRLDVAFGELLHSTMDHVDSNGFELANPVVQDENILERLTARQTEYFAERLQRAVYNVDRALKARTTHKADEYWRRLFGIAYPRRTALSRHSHLIDSEEE